MGIIAAAGQRPVFSVAEEVLLGAIVYVKPDLTLFLKLFQNPLGADDWHRIVGVDYAFLHPSRLITLRPKAVHGKSPVSPTNCLHKVTISSGTSQFARCLRTT